jgi:hypothetical protein
VPNIGFQERMPRFGLFGTQFVHRMPDTGLFGLDDATTDYSPSWFDIVGTLRQVGPALAQAEANLNTAADAAYTADINLDPTGESTPNQDAFDAAGGTDTLDQLNTAIQTYDSIVNALNTVSAIFPGGPIALQGLGGILPDSIGGWTLSGVLAFFGPLGPLLAAAASIFQSTTGTTAPGASTLNTLNNAITATNNAVNNAITAIGNAPAAAATAAAGAAASIGKYAVIGIVAFLLGDALIHKEGLL